jgi:hypothetical protein
MIERYTMTRRDLETILLTLESTPALLSRAAESLPERARIRPAAGGFSLVENVWHLADLEREGYAVRIERLLHEIQPALPNFDGDRLARERAYQERDLEQGLALFREARTRNLEALRNVSADGWDRAGLQDGVGRVTLADIPRMMADHDRAHGADIADLLAEIRGEEPRRRPHPTSAVA